MTTPVFAFLTDTKEAVAELVNNCLLVAGGFLLGYLLGGLIGWAIEKHALKQQQPGPTRKAGRPICGVLVALLVALHVFTGKGKGPGPGGDEPGATRANSNDKTPLPQVPDKSVSPKPPTPTPPEMKVTGTTVQVTVLGGSDVVEGRQYQVDADATPLTEDELRKVLTERKEKAKGKVTVAIVMSPRNPLKPDHPAVTRVARWAHDNELDVTFPANR